MIHEFRENFWNFRPKFYTILWKALVSNPASNSDGAGGGLESLDSLESSNHPRRILIIVVNRSHFFEFLISQ